MVLERESFPSLLNRVGYVRRSESEGERVCQSDEERKEGEGRKGREGKGGWMIAAAAAGALGFVQRATRRASQPARKNLAAREGGREEISRGGSKL